MMTVHLMQKIRSNIKTKQNSATNEMLRELAMHEIRQGCFFFFPLLLRKFKRFSVVLEGSSVVLSVKFKVV